MKRYKNRFFVYILCLILAASCFEGCGGCQNIMNRGQRAYQATVFAMDTVMDITVYGKEELIDDAKSLIVSLEHKFSTTDTESEIYALNLNKEAYLSEETAELLKYAVYLCESTGGALDISVYPLVKAWGFTTGEYRVPGKEEISELLKTVNYGNIIFSDETTVKLSEKMSVDLGSVAKGYTGDRITKLFRENGVTSALLNLGGNVHALGAKPDKSPWRVAVANPKGGYAGVVEIVDKAVITSGGYERFFEKDGVRYHHIIDPSTGYPADNGLASVTVVGEKGVVCDALSTALFVMGLDAAAEFWRDAWEIGADDDIKIAVSSFDAVFIMDDGSIYITEGLENAFSLYDGNEAEVNVLRRN